MDVTENGAKSNIAVSVHSRPENAVKLVHERKCSAPMRDSKPHKEADEQVDRKDTTKPDNGACRQGPTPQPDVKEQTKDPRSSSQRIAYRAGQKFSLDTMVGKTSVQKPSSWIPNNFWKKEFTWSCVSNR